MFRSMEVKVHPDDPKDNGDKVPAATYAWMIPVVTRIARRHGYAIGVHGSMSRDLDLIAVPWVDDANDPALMVEEILRLTDGKIAKHPNMPEADWIEVKPHGRRAWTIVFDGAWHSIDLSVMPKAA
jgi:hypothetical protein